MSLILSLFDNRSRVFDPFSLDVWDPFQEFAPFSRDFSRIDDITHLFTNTQIDWKETSDSHIFKADLLGLKKDEVKIEVERLYDNFRRHFRLPKNAKVDEIKAVMDNGILTVTIPKQAQPKLQVRTIDISG